MSARYQAYVAMRSKYPMPYDGPWMQLVSQEQLQHAILEVTDRLRPVVQRLVKKLVEAGVPSGMSREALPLLQQYQVQGSEPADWSLVDCLEMEFRDELRSVSVRNGLVSVELK